jgi:hypothetical protein
MYCLFTNALNLNQETYLYSPQKVSYVLNLDWETHLCSSQKVCGIFVCPRTAHFPDHENHNIQVDKRIS